MSKKLLSIVVVLSMLLTMLGTALPSLADGPTKTGITIDGNISDWAGIDPVAQDTAGTGTNITYLYFTKDSSNIYIRIDGTFIGPNVPMHIGFDTDLSTSTGYNTTNPTNIFTQSHGMGIDRVIDLNYGPHPILSSWSSSGQPTPIDTTSLSVASNFVQGQQPPSTFHYEISLPINLMPNAGPWNIVAWVQGPTPPTAIDELPSTGYVTYPFPAPTQRALTTTVSPVSSGTIARSPDQATYDNGTSVQLTATPATGYQFTNWSGDVTSTDNPVSVTMDADKTVTANFTPVSPGQNFYLTNTPNLSTSNSTPTGVWPPWMFGTQGVWACGTNPPYATANINYPAGTWTGHVSFGYYYTGLPSNYTGSIRFTLGRSDPYGVSGDQHGAGTYWFGSQTVTYNNQSGVDLAIVGTSFQVPSNHGQLILQADLETGDQISVMFGGANSYITSPAGSPMYPDGGAAPTQHTLTMAISGNGSTSPAVGAHPYVEGTVVQITATPADGYTFSGWTGAVANSSNASTSVTMDTDKIVTATFTQNPPTQYTLAVTIVGQGIVAKSPDQTTYDSGSQVQLTETPADGWNFAGWSMDASGTTNPITVTMNGNKNVTANFTQSQMTCPQ